MSEDLQSLTRATSTIESEHPDVVGFGRRHSQGARDKIDAAVRLYYAVRDGFRYDPFDRKGNKHMEYVTDRGEFEDAPIDAMIATFREKYSQRLAEGMQGFSRSNFEDEVEAEIAESE
jgi:hypothetical protein